LKLQEIGGGKYGVFDIKKAPGALSRLAMSRR